MKAHDDLLDKTSANEFLRECLKQLKEDAGGVTTIHLSRKLGIPNSTLGRIENREVETPDFNNALKIVRAKCKEDAVIKFINKFYPQMATTFKAVYAGNSEVPFVSMNVEPFFEDISTYEFMLLASTKMKITEEMIFNNYGKRGLAKVHELLEQGVLKKRGDAILLASSNINAGQEVVHRLFQNLITHNYDVTAFGDKENWLSLQYESVDKEVVMPAMLKVLREANQKIREILQAPSSRGNDVVWAGLSADTIDKLDPIYRQEKQISMAVGGAQ
ncbi:MAG: hypothetical protein A2504_12090 [Bdellovibrionales bacterium RIFOXYD12_FULL_39_22]|nr:MAG: hypothetical protein A2385_01810 [Bdellovibrionales bacterium RIFOXYB1_FULL_39_21]OFZ46434.1 MAG: hypothetical protein A2404_09045 [Bdellovibrionales bacterium RIFOXYC1_FULL_39_130]OFZ72469.1 MAG: hypothetical protein A2451_08970 [Bdellovibrionales bacterium RIFOXYC2_FULL_39_8]OFZ75040.1 MAG: hypothetical protein A2560_10660 [Bdellovibrionales bacterium RIFOXYD1_FULL_39_84]OFZ94859.1 MAG: hypothetical protein A2504_12090 [Bdellovibrionales bacterium RIFOXYD12_FULL_39_22]HLE12152.1 heli